MADRQEGTIKMWNSERGFGFASREGQEDIFIHISELQNSEVLKEGDRIEFEEGKDPISGRTRAVQVKLL